MRAHNWCSEVLRLSARVLSHKTFSGLKRNLYSVNPPYETPSAPFTQHPHRNGKMATYQNGAAPARALDDSDVEEEALVADYQEQVQYEDGLEELEHVNSLTMAQQTDDIQSRLAAAAQPLDFAAPLEVKFQSYDSYCSLFHFILNSDGPVDLEPPSVSADDPTTRSKGATSPRVQMLTSRRVVLLGLGCHR